MNTNYIKQRSRRIYAITLCFILMLSASAAGACSGNNSGSADNTSDSAAASSEIAEELPMPKIPESITGRDEKLAYAATHFWDVMNFEDTTRSHNDAFMEQNFANFAYILQLQTKKEAQRDAVSALLRKASVEKGALEKVKDVAELYLADPNSPMVSEDIWMIFLRVMIDEDGFCNSTEKMRYSFELSMREKNYPGMTAADFSYADINGNKHTLLSTPTGKEGIVVLFFDPDCEHCKETITSLTSDPTLTEKLKSGDFTLLAIDVEDNKELWKSAAESFPKDWIVGINTDDLREREAYWLQALPSIYVLDDKYIVKKKDAIFPNIF